MFDKLQITGNATSVVTAAESGQKEVKNKEKAWIKQKIQTIWMIVYKKKVKCKIYRKKLHPRNIFYNAKN